MGKYYHRQCSRKVAEGGLVYYVAELQLLMPDGKLHYLCGSFPEGDEAGIRFTAASESMYDLMIGKAEEVDEDIVYYASWRGKQAPEGSGYQQAADFLWQMAAEKYAL